MAAARDCAGRLAAGRRTVIVCPSPEMAALLEAETGRLLREAGVALEEGTAPRPPAPPGRGMTWLETFREGMGVVLDGPTRVRGVPGKTSCVALAVRLGLDTLERVRKASVKLARMIRERAAASGAGDWLEVPLAGWREVAVRLGRLGTAAARGVRAALRRGAGLVVAAAGGRRAVIGEDALAGVKVTGGEPAPVMAPGVRVVAALPKKGMEGVEAVVVLGRAALLSKEVNLRQICVSCARRAAGMALHVAGRVGEESGPDILARRLSRSGPGAGVPVRATEVEATRTAPLAVPCPTRGRGVALLRKKEKEEAEARARAKAELERAEREKAKAVTARPRPPRTVPPLRTPRGTAPALEKQRPAHPPPEPPEIPHEPEVADDPHAGEVPEPPAPAPVRRWRGPSI